MLGASLALYGAYQAWRGLLTLGWLPAQGRVTEAFLSGEESEGDGAAVTTYYRSGVLYTYFADGQAYEGDTLQCGAFPVPFKFFAQREVARYQAGQGVTVYYRPRDPSQAVLRRGAPASAFALLAAGIACLIAASSIR